MPDIINTNLRKNAERESENEQWENIKGEKRRPKSEKEQEREADSWHRQ